MTEQQKLTRPPESGPGSDINAWIAFASQELDVPTSEFDGLKRHEVIALLDSSPKASEAKDDEGRPTGVRVIPEADATKLREAPDGVTVVESAADVRDALDRRTWAVPVAGGYAAENEITDAER